MILKRISILNYKNLEQVELNFSAKLNCFFGQNGMGKTNLLDAVYFLSFCKSAGNPIDSQNIRHEQDFFVIQGFYEAMDGTPEEIYCGMKRRSKKQFKRNKKEYSRLSDHIGFIPLVMVSPADSELIAGGSDERRRFMDVVISQYDKEYLDALIRYNKALVQRNTLLKSEQPIEEELFLVWEEMMAQAGEVVFRKREAFISEFIPIFQSFYYEVVHVVELETTQFDHVDGVRIFSHLEGKAVPDVPGKPSIHSRLSEDVVSQHGRRRLAIASGDTDHLGIRVPSGKFYLGDDRRTFLLQFLYDRSLVGNPRTLDNLVGIQDVGFGMPALFPTDTVGIQHILILGFDGREIGNEHIESFRLCQHGGTCATFTGP